ncbi:Hypothetical predicted protein, partial [Scomber scombrus]
MVVDVTICFEKTFGTLLAAEHTKVANYLYLEGPVKELLPGVRTVTVDGFPLGARGKMARGKLQGTRKDRDKQ